MASTFLWFGNDDSKLSQAAKTILEEPSNDIRISIASFCEVAIKNSHGKLPLKANVFGLEREAKELSIEILPISIKAIHEVTLLSQDHKDPFDRMIAATAITEGDILLSSGVAFDRFGVNRIW